MSRKTVHIGILLISSGGDRKNMQSLRITIEPSFEEAEPVEPVQMIIYQSNTYRKDLSWLHFDDEPRVQER